MRTLTLILSLLLIFSCKSRNEAQNTASAEEQKPEKDTVVVMVEKPTSPDDTLVIAFEKTPCFGRCPVYKVKVYESGFATYEGLNFTEKMGLYAYRFSEPEIESIYNRAVEIGYFELKSEYDDKLITDLPSTISEINYKDKSHRVKARINAPEKLINFHKNLAVTLQEKDWETYSER
ncbi:MAG: DUF6438 domain-containing protein [Cryomorphaceae bacterium]|nr:DUF6438 domain-containing protein [Flavobacteriales bacterium]